MRRTAIIAIALAAALAVFGTSCSQGPSSDAAEGQIQKASVVRVVDGDTLVVDIDGAESKVRLIGVDTPESVAADESRNCEEGRIASEYTKSLCPSGTKVWLEKDVSDTDKYGRLLRYVWLSDPSAASLSAEESMLNAILVRDGYAQARRYEPDTAYATLFEQLGGQASQAQAGVSYKWS